jgi:hypothetical protein
MEMFKYKRGNNMLALYSIVITLSIESATFVAYNEIVNYIYHLISVH